MNKNEEYKDFLDKCKSVDFSEHSKNKDKILETLCENFNGNVKEEIIMNNRKPKRKTMVAASLAAALIVTSGTVFATGFDKVIKTYVLGDYSKHIQEEITTPIPVPKELEGKVFDDKGSALKEVKRDIPFFNADGKRVDIIKDKSGKYSLITEEEALAQNEKEAAKMDFVTFTDLKEASSYFITDIVNPTYLPQGYAFEEVQFYGDSKEKMKKGKDGDKYMDIHYSNGKENITCMIRYMDEETAYEISSSGKIEEKMINGNKALIHENSLTILIGDVEYAFYADDVSMDELIKVAESLK